MSTKQIKMEFQVVADDGISANVTVTAGGTQVFSGPLAHTVAVMPGQVYNDQTPYSLVEFDFDVANLPHPLTGTAYVLTDMTISVTGGSICLQETEANYAVSFVEVTPPTSPPTWQQVPGDATTFPTLNYGTQPVWTPPAVGRLDIADNTGTGPGSLLLLENESVAYQVEMSYYSAA